MASPDPPAVIRLEHALRAHEAELETQNEELRTAQLDLAAARDRYRDLFDFAPVGVLTLDEAGCIAEVNLMGASLLGAERSKLHGQPFARLVDAPDRRHWHAHWKAAPPAPGRGRLELVLRRQDRSTFAAQLDTLRIAEQGQAGRLRLALSDISQRRSAETDRRIAAHLVEAREDERRRVAHTLHEDLGQRLSALKMRAGAELHEELDQAIALVRRMVNELRPVMLDQLGLHATLEWLARDAGRRLGIEVSLQAEDTGALALDERTSVGLYRVMECLLADIARHTPRAAAMVRVGQQGNRLVVQVRVQGSGWPLEQEARHTAALPAGEPGSSGEPAGAAPTWAAAPGAATSAARDALHLLRGELLEQLQPDGTRMLTLSIPHAPGRAGRTRPA